MLFAACAPWARGARRPGRLTAPHRSGYLPLGFPPRLNSAAPPLHKSPSHLEDRQIDTSLLLRIFHPTAGSVTALRRARPEVPRPRVPPQTQGTLSLQLFPSFAVEPKGPAAPHYFPALILPPLLRSVRTVSAPSPSGHAWQAWLPRTLAEY